MLVLLLNASHTCSQFSRVDDIAIEVEEEENEGKVG